MLLRVVGAAPAGAWSKVGFQTCLALLHSQGSPKQCPRWSEQEQGHGQPQPAACPLRSASLQRPCALGQTVTCCGGMSHTTTKSLVFHREPGTVSILIPLGLAGSVPLPAADEAHGAAGQVFSHSTVLPFHHPSASLAWSERKYFDYPVTYFRHISFLVFFWSVNLLLKSVAPCFAFPASIPAVQLINLPLMILIQVSHNILLGSPVRSLCRNLYYFLVFFCETVHYSSWRWFILYSWASSSCFFSL